MIAEQAMRAAETTAVRAASPLPTNVSSEVRLSRLEDKVDQILTELKRARVTPLTSSLEAHMGAYGIFRRILKWT